MQRARYETHSVTISWFDDDICVCAWFDDDVCVGVLFDADVCVCAWFDADVCVGARVDVAACMSASACRLTSSTQVTMLIPAMSATM